MANPNIVNVTSIYGGVVTALPTTTETNVLENDASSGSILKVNSILVANIDGTVAADVTVKIGMVGGSDIAFAKDISVPAKSTLTIIDKGTSLYLPENWRLRASASANSRLSMIISYEEIS
jgi:hypothetical protein